MRAAMPASQLSRKFRGEETILRQNKKKALLVLLCIHVCIDPLETSKIETLISVQ